MTTPVLQFILSAGAIIVAGIFLARAADSIAELTKLGRLIVGSVFLAGATSLPEILVDLSSVRKGMPDLAVGDLMGSSLFNLFILAIADLMHRNPHKIFSRVSAAHALSAAMSIHMAAMACIAIFLEQRLSGFEFGAIGLGPLAIGVSYLLGLRLMYFDQRSAIAAGAAPRDSAAERPGRGAMVKALSVFGVCTLVILIASPFLAEAAGKLSDATGLGKTFVGTTLVAFCTSLPEMVSTVTAVRIGAFDLAVGNIFGSNSFNMLILIPLDLFHEGSLLAAVNPSHILTALATILATSVAVMGQLYQAEKRKKFIEPDAFAIIGISIGALLLLYYVSTA
ncbi:MAG TPA: sodium:calcium antiporter [bacterium]|nr:sodium:calcium antiporter [bacterium]